MRRYETIVIIDPDLSAEQRTPVLERVKDVIEQQDGYLALTDDWGARKLAYEIKKKEGGYYVRFDFCATGAVVDEMERFFRIDDRVLKYMTVLLDNTADIEKIKEEVALAQSKVAVPEEQAALSETPTSSEGAKLSENQMPEAQPQAQPEVKPEPQPEAKPEAKPEPQAEVKPEAQAEVKPEAQPEVKIEEAEATPTKIEEETK